MLHTVDCSDHSTHRVCGKVLARVLARNRDLPRHRGRRFSSLDSCTGHVRCLSLAHHLRIVNRLVSQAQNAALRVDVVERSEQQGAE
eukprot:456449-Prymnesium_polylepis.1